MAEDRMALYELMQKAGEGDFLRTFAEVVLQVLMEADVEGVIGVGRHERNTERLNYRNGFRDRTLYTRLGQLSLRIPKLRQGSDFPAFLGAAQDQRESAGGRHPGGLDQRCLHPARGRSGAGHGLVGHLQIASVQALQRHRRAGQRLPLQAS